MTTQQKPLWDIETKWFTPSSDQLTSQTFLYKSWKDFQECKPYRFWKPYILSSWCWKDDTLQIVFLSANKFQGLYYSEMPVKKEDEPLIRAWLKSHMPKLWEL